MFIILGIGAAAAFFIVENPIDSILFWGLFVTANMWLIGELIIENSKEQKK